MVRIEWSEPACADLREVHDYIARDSARYAQLTIDRITETAGLLAAFPELGEVLSEFPKSGYRQLVVGAYRLIYRHDRRHDRVLIMGVIHSSRDLPPILEDR